VQTVTDETQGGKTGERGLGGITFTTSVELVKRILPEKVWSALAKLLLGRKERPSGEVTRRLNSEKRIMDPKDGSCISQRKLDGKEQRTG